MYKRTSTSNCFALIRVVSMDLSYWTSHRRTPDPFVEGSSMSFTSMTCLRAGKSIKFVSGTTVARAARGTVNGKSFLPCGTLFPAVKDFFRIKITNVSRNEIYEFPVEKLLDENVEAGSSNLILFSETKEEINEGELATPRTTNAWGTVQCSTSG